MARRVLLSILVGMWIVGELVTSSLLPESFLRLLPWYLWILIVPCVIVAIIEAFVSCYLHFIGRKPKGTSRETEHDGS